jgi:hypothetical protein
MDRKRGEDSGHVRREQYELRGPINLGCNFVRGTMSIMTTSYICHCLNHIFFIFDIEMMTFFFAILVHLSKFV